MFVLRDYQDEGIDEVREAIRAGYRRILLVAPTGSGKTVVAAQIVKSAAEKLRWSTSARVSWWTSALITAS